MRKPGKRVVPPIETYKPERKAEFLLANAVDERDYEGAKSEVRRLGVDPGKVRAQKLRSR